MLRMKHGSYTVEWIVDTVGNRYSATVVMSSTGAGASPTVPVPLRYVLQIGCSLLMLGGPQLLRRSRLKVLDDLMACKELPEVVDTGMRVQE